MLSLLGCVSVCVLETERVSIHLTGLNGIMIGLGPLPAAAVAVIQKDGYAPIQQGDISPRTNHRPSKTSARCWLGDQF